MRKALKIFICMICLNLSISGQTTLANENKVTSEYIKTARQDILSVMLAYSEYIKDIRMDKNGNILLVDSNENEIVYDDKRIKNNAQKLSDPDIQDMLELIYPLQNDKTLKDIDFDPGRARVYWLFSKAYGTNKAQIEKSLTNVKVINGQVRFSSNNGASAALHRTMQQLKVVSGAKPYIIKFLAPCSGTYNYRYISGTNRLSAHAFGIAIDLASNKSDYWKWASRESGAKRIAEYPDEIVKIFESNNFVWGGKWGHFDILHFEYRPEIILKAKLANSTNSNSPWYAGIDMENETAKIIIKKIEDVIK